MEDQDKVITRKTDCEDVAVEASNKATLEVGRTLRGLVVVACRSIIYARQSRSRRSHARLDVRRLASAKLWSTLKL